MLKGVQDTRTTHPSLRQTRYVLGSWNGTPFVTSWSVNSTPSTTPTPTSGAKPRRSRRRSGASKGSSVLVWHGGAFTTIALVDSTLPHTPPPEPKKGGVVMDVAAGQLPNAKDEKALVSALRKLDRLQGVRDISVGRLRKVLRRS